MPTGDVAAPRWLRRSKYELAYHGKIVLLDTFYGPPARTASVGFRSIKCEGRRDTNEARALEALELTGNLH